MKNKLIIFLILIAGISASVSAQTWTQEASNSADIPRMPLIFEDSSLYTQNYTNPQYQLVTYDSNTLAINDVRDTYVFDDAISEVSNIDYRAVWKYSDNKYHILVDGGIVEFDTSAKTFSYYHQFSSDVLAIKAEYYPSRNKVFFRGSNVMEFDYDTNSVNTVTSNYDLEGIGRYNSTHLLVANDEFENNYIDLYNLDTDTAETIITYSGDDGRGRYVTANPSNGYVYADNGLGELEIYDDSFNLQTTLTLDSTVSGLILNPTNQFITVRQQGDNLEVYNRFDNYNKVLDKTDSTQMGAYSDDSNNFYYITTGNQILRYGTSGLVEPPTVSFNNDPVDGSSFTLDYGQTSKSIDYNFTVDTKGLDTNYTVYTNGTATVSGTISASGTPVEQTGTFSAPTGDTTVYAEVTNTGGSDTTETRTVTVNSKTQPSVDITSPTNGEVFYTTQGSTKEIPFSGYVNGSQEVGTAYARAIFAESTTEETNYEINLGSITDDGSDQFFEGNMTVGQFGTYTSGRIDAEYSGTTFSSNEISFKLKSSNPQITNLSISPQIPNSQVGDTFNITVDGDVTVDEIDRIEYDIDVAQQDVDTVTSDPIDFQDQNQFTDSVRDVFEIQESYQGKDVAITATVFDTQGRTDSDSRSATLGTPPDSFILDSPNDGQVFLIPEGSTEIPVDFEYGVDTAGRSGTVELLLNGNPVDSFSASADTTATQQYTQNISDGDYTYSVRFTDDQDGEVYTSASKSFDVTDEPINLNLNSPTGDITTADDTIDSLSHDFEIDARALPSQYYYTFKVNNTDTASVVTDRTSGNFDTGIAQYSETLQDVSTGNYTWEVEVFKSSNDKKLESKTTSYTVVSNPLFEQDLIRPVDNEKFFVDNENDEVTVNGTFEIKSYKTSVDSTIRLDGNQVSTFTTSKDNRSRYDFNLQDLGTGSYTLELESTDTDGRSQTSQVNFEIATRDNQSIEFTDIRTIPDLEKASAGDEIDVYVEGSGNVSDVDFLQLEITSQGETIDTILVDTDNLKSGSWYTTVDNAFTVTEDLIGEDVGILGTARSTAGDTISYFESWATGSAREVAVFLNDPADDRTFEQEDGDVEDIRFSFDVVTVLNDVDATLQIRPNGSSTYYDAAQDTVTKTDSRVVLETFVNLVENPDINQQFGTFDWRVLADEQNSNVNATSTTRSFTVTRPENVTLNLNSPSDGQPFYINTAGDSRDIQFSFDVDTSEAGTLTLDIDGTQVYEREVNSGFSQDTVVKDMPVGVYDARLEFNSDSLSKNITNTFSVEQNEPELDDPEVKLIEPEQDATVYKSIDGGSVGRKFAWSVFNSADSGSGEGNTTVYIEDDTGSVVETFERDYDTQNERVVFSELYSVDLNIGDYEWYAEFDGDNLNSTISSGRRSFTVQDFKPPAVTGITPKNVTVADDENPTFRFSVETFEQSPELELRLREAGEFNSEVIYSTAQEAGVSRTYEYNGSKLDAGDYEWFVRSKINPEFDSKVYSFSVEKANIDAPDFKLRKPEQGATIETTQNETGVLFDYSVTAYSQKDAQVDLMLQRVNDEGSGTYESIKNNLQRAADGIVRYNHTETLNESGYRYRVRVEYPNGQVNYSETRSFIVDSTQTESTPALPDPEPQLGIFAEGAKLLGSINSSYKAAVGTTGQFFTATIIILLAAGGLQLGFKMEYLTMLTTVLLATGFSLADGYYPLAVFWIILAVSSGLVGLLGLKWMTGGD